ncbi:hypothetical protein DSO57_1020257 [Entomophthora muscae]|uniref:Uncharacterized protein n=1 Tax=Entomophthora muscae TaxID=34485 RepID=A0ACC2UEK3_9FUNG|nr:hypothetical protein DSO57_1020257 [Entomophthora muscae]
MGSYISRLSFQALALSHIATHCSAYSPQTELSSSAIVTHPAIRPDLIPSLTNPGSIVIMNPRLRPF